MEVTKSVRASMRLIGRLYLEYKKLIPMKEHGVRTMYTRKHFQALREAINILTDRDTDGNSDNAPIKYGLKNNLYHLLCITTTFLRGSYLEKEGREAEAQEVQMFEKVLKLNEMVIFADFVELRSAVCSRLTLFNARRGVELSRLKIRL